MKSQKSEKEAAKKLEELRVRYETARQQKIKKQQRAQLLKHDKKKLESELQRTKLEGQIALQRYDTKVEMLQKQVEQKPKVIVKQSLYACKSEEETSKFEIYEILANKCDTIDIRTAEGIAEVQGYGKSFSEWYFNRKALEHEKIAAKLRSPVKPRQASRTRATASGGGDGGDNPAKVKTEARSEKDEESERGSRGSESYSLPTASEQESSHSHEDTDRDEDDGVPTPPGGGDTENHDEKKKSGKKGKKAKSGGGPPPGGGGSDEGNDDED